MMVNHIYNHNDVEVWPLGMLHDVTLMHSLDGCSKSLFSIFSNSLLH